MLATNCLMPGRMDAAQASPVSAWMAVSREQDDHPLVPRWCSRPGIAVPGASAMADRQSRSASSRAGVPPAVDRQGRTAVCKLLLRPALGSTVRIRSPDPDPLVPLVPHAGWRENRRCGRFCRWLSRPRPSARLSTATCTCGISVTTRCSGCPIGLSCGTCSATMTACPIGTPCPITVAKRRAMTCAA
jgi:hypothetical protein